jgi:RNA polymerase sigma factor (sigma-70 family)
MAQGHGRISKQEGTALNESMDYSVSGDDPLAALITDESRRRLWRRVEALPLGQRTAVILHYRQDMQINEVAQALGVTSGTVKTLLFRARQTLRQATSGSTHAFFGGIGEQET